MAAASARMELELKDKVAVITGGAGGVGGAVAKALLREGAAVVLAGREAGALAETAARIDPSGERVATVAGDLAPGTDAVERLVPTALDRFGRLDALVNCAGTAPMGDPLELGAQAYLDAMASKYGPYVSASIAVARHLAEQRSGAIVSVVGVGGLEPFPTFLAGGAANAALLLFSKGLARRLAEDGVRVVALSPSLVDTQRRRAIVDANARQQGVSYEQADRRSTAAIPLGRAVAPAEVGDVVAFLLSARAAYVTGSHIVLDGGQTHAV